MNITLNKMNKDYHDNKFASAFGVYSEIPSFAF